MYKKVSTDMNFVAREEEVLSFWKENEIFKKAQAAAEGKPEFTFYDGPPTANGKPHIGHILTRCIKDLFPRYKAMDGYNVLRKAGWDTHGLPVELEVEKMLGLDGKEQIEEYGVEDFIAKCKESVWKYKGEWEKMSDRVGYWADMEDPYVTYEDNYIESEWWSLKKIYEKGLLYKGHKIVPYCPRCGTALSSHEVAQGYKDVKERSATVRFRCTDEENTSFLAWTTTPWTLPSNVCLCVNAHVEYAKVRKGGEYFIMAKDLIEGVLGSEDVEIIHTCTGAELVGRTYEPLFECTEKACGGKKAFFVIADDYVTTTDGTGIVHNAPAFGEDDARVCRENDLPFVQLVDTKGEMCGGTPWDGTFVKDADPIIIKELDEAGLLFAAPVFEHSYPHCWRCNTPLIYYARSSWFIKMTALREKLLENNSAINWLPDNIKDGRMGNFLDGVIDWGVSRERYWGTPLPVWTCECGHIHVIGSREELIAMGDDVPADIELHKPFIDKVTLTCEKCGGKMHRVPEVIDCWYDSGSMPFAQWHYPFENKEEFARRFPANFISEAVDQTRGWFYTLIAIGTLIFDRAPFENCIVLGHVQDKDGRKMSKHIGNVVDPWTVLDKQGADAVRWYFYSNSAPWLPNRFYDAAVSESQRKFMGTLWNTYAFYILYADIDKFDPTQYKLEKDRLCVMDKWVLSRLNSLVKAVRANLDNYRITEAARDLNKFVDELSNWYVRRGRERYWGSEMTDDKVDAYMTLYTVLETLARLIAPFTPFMAEAIYQNIVRTVDENAPISVHLTTYPEADEQLIDAELEENMDKVLSIVVLGRACRNTANIKNRQPIGRLFVGGIDSLPDSYKDIIKGELNVKNVEVGAATEEFITYNIKPQMRTLGPKYGKLLGGIRNHLANGDGAAIAGAVKNGGTYHFELDGTSIDLKEEDMLIEPKQKEGFAVESDGGVAVILDTELTEELIREGYLREVVSKVQTMRKEAGFEVTDHIALYVADNDLIAGLVEENKAQVAGEVLADEVVLGSMAGYSKEWDINGQKTTLGVEKK
ncbi:MAG: isoleucine--tRNA ligase [Christensenellaceae bacterium]|nr:isoleucine--tRNA ligase [Christensenellaceae bacterium]